MFQYLLLLFNIDEEFSHGNICKGNIQLFKLCTWDTYPCFHVNFYTHFRSHTRLCFKLLKHVNLLDNLKKLY